MKQRVREYLPIGKRTYITRTYDGIFEFLGTKFLTGVVLFFLNLIWIPIKYTSGLPFIVLE